MQLALESSCLSTLNLCEVLSRFSRDGMDAGKLQEKLAQSSIEFVSFGAREAVDAAQLVPITRPFGLSLGDRACLALGKARNIPVLTADKIWLQLPIDVDVKCIR